MFSEKLQYNDTFLYFSFFYFICNFLGGLLQNITSQKAIWTFFKNSHFVFYI